MLTEPEVFTRDAQPYVAIRASVTMQTIGTVLPDLHPQVFAWLGERGIPPVGPPFWKYNVIDMERALEVEVGAPVAAAVDGDDRVLAGVLPAGRYATLRHAAVHRAPRRAGRSDRVAAGLGRAAAPGLGRQLDR
jgi:effector-binding domain-containing protein